MAIQEQDKRILDQLSRFYGPNAGYALDLYERYQQDPNAVDPATRAFFDSLQVAEGSGPVTPRTTESRPTPALPPQVAGTTAASDISKIVAGAALAHAIRERGHLGARLDPLGTPPLGDPALLPETHGLTEADLSRLPAAVVGGHAAEGATNALEAVRRLREMYSGTISYQFDQVKSHDERMWLRDAVGLRLFQRAPGTSEARERLRRLTQVEAFERYLHQTFVGQKRFSLEGTDALIPMLDEIVSEALTSNTREVLFGMAHRGRLNVLAHVLHKPYRAILAEFSHTHPITSDDEENGEYQASGWSGDVKYHLGAKHLIKKNSGGALRLLLAPNPSHLEYVNPVVQGMTRADQDDRYQPGPAIQDVDRTLTVVIHGDGAFPGEGIVAETLNLWNLRGYTVGGALHIIVNNQIGFTTEPEDGRSTLAASDLAKGFEIPIIRVNADDPDAAITAIRLAKAYRDRFHKDVLVDLLGYRRWGHNEGDEPAFTQPQMYDFIRKHPTVRELYARQLEKAGIIQPGEADVMVKEAFQALEQAKSDVEAGVEVEKVADEADEQHLLSEADLDRQAPPKLSADELRELNAALLDWPADFSPNAKLGRLLQRRATSIEEPGGIDWGHAESLALASILAEGTPVRMSGQDVERGTFSHRHAVLHDQRSGATYAPLQHFAGAEAAFSIYNSPISESAVLGFEYGYSVRAGDSLVIWEAQFGDFANVAQVIIDQFISSGRAKWRQSSGLVLLLPHGLEGQGPEHSSARLERYLALCAANNWRVANCSTAAQYFHLLRQQAFELKRDPRPLVVMSPKSLLRHPQSAASLDQLTGGQFRPVLDDPTGPSRAGQVRRVLLCTGKVGIDLLGRATSEPAPDVAIVRLELLYPFPVAELKKALAGYPNLQEVIWVQEEPLNMGAWKYLVPRLGDVIEQPWIERRVIARPENPSPATGFIERYQAEQEQILNEALRSPVRVS